MSGVGSPPPQGIGQFIIGVSQIGTPSFLDWTKTVISQYANSPILLALLDAFDRAEDPTEVFDDFFDNVWNLDTAVGYGLDVWGRIVGVTRIVKLTTPGTFFGFEEALPGDEGFNSAPFFNASKSVQNFSLSDKAFRQLIYAKAFANITDGSIPGLNKLLLTLFGDSGPAWVTDNNDMSMTYTFGFTPTPIQKAIIQSSGVLPQPSGVSVSVVIL